MLKMNLGDEQLTRSELLAINHIYYFDADGLTDIANHLTQLDNDALTSMKEELEHDDGYAALCSDTKRCCDIFEEVYKRGIQVTTYWKLSY